MKFNFYDIESLTNVFTLANYRSYDNAVEIYYLCDDPALIADPDFQTKATARIHRNNKNFTGTVEFYDLHDSESNYRLARTFGLTDAYYANNPNNKSSYDRSYRLVCDTDPEYDENIYPFLLGYNSYHYDTTMITLYLYDAIDDRNNSFHCQTAKRMRQYNDELFSDEFDGPCRNMEDRLRCTYKDPARPSKGYERNFKTPTAVIRKNMLMSGRHLDVARINEKQSKVGLKRLLGMLGYQILESDKLRPGQDTIETADQLLDLIAYNVSDVVNLEKLFMHKIYQSGFTLKKQLLKTYPELIYAEKDDTYKPDVSPFTVRNDRLVIDSSSAQFATKALCPYGHLQDYDTVSFMYPSQAKADALGIPRLNILEESKKFFYNNFKQPELRARFDEIYNYYKSIEGKNFNASKNYLIDHGIDLESCPDPEILLPDELRIHKLSEIPTPNTCMFYYRKDGSPSTCFVNFSTGGIHGAEYNVKLYEADVECFKIKRAAWEKQCAIFDEAKRIYPDPRDLKINKGITINGVKYKPSDFLKPKATAAEAYYKDYPKMPKAPSVFKHTQTSSSDSWNIDPRYTFTSAAMTNHEDFTSYYPNMLRMMDAFFNPGLGYDRYGEIFDDKTRYGKLMKDKSLSQEERDLYSVMREGTKLILNSASGAGDANFESNVRMNNKIISMRIIGQLFTWRIGQAQTIEGASIISTNTDGLYSVLEAEYNNKILARESESIHVDIEPEPIFLISKDSNNRTEIKANDGQLGEIIGASGGTLSCRKGPTPAKALAHPAIIDWALCEYLTIASICYKGTSLAKPFDDTIGRSIISSARKAFNDDVHTLLMFQNVIASSPGSQRFIFATSDTDLTAAIPLQHYNRCFIVKDKTPGAYHLKAAVAKVITDAMQKKRVKNNERAQQHDPIASEILAINGVKSVSLPLNKEATVTKITGVEEEWYMLVNNNDLHYLTQDQINNILDNLDYDKYLSLLRNSYENNWLNATPEEETADNELSAKIDIFADNSDTPEQLQSDAANTVSVNTAAVSPQPEPSCSDPIPAMSEDSIAPFESMSFPKCISLNKTVLSPTDIYQGEKVLKMHGIREVDAHMVFSKLMKSVTDTDIDV